jgi:hypothetical protein
MRQSGAIRRVRAPGRPKIVPASRNYRKYEYYGRRDRDTVLILVLFLLLVVVLLYFS